MLRRTITTAPIRKGPIMHYQKFVALLLAGAASAATVPFASAQTADAPVAAPATTDDGAPDGDIIVTANRRSENTINVPIAVSVIRARESDVVAARSSSEVAPALESRC